MNENRFKSCLRPVSFGRYIRAIRIRKGIKLQTVADDIGISLHQLYLIETEDHDELPNADFVKEVLRSYANYIEIDADDLIDRYEINRSATLPSRRSGKRKERTGVMSMLPRLFLALVVVLAMGGLLSASVYYGWQSLFDRNNQSEATSPREASAAPNRGAHVSDSLVLTIDATEKTWIKINIDGEEPLEYLLRPKDHVELEAGSHYHMLIGNAGGLEMKLNGEPVRINGKSGEVVTLELPRPKTNRIKNNAE
ncbi:MAG: DUF4115 domain-containing protein [Desulfobacterales bacterium]|nr:DUF4115 domain-containing protein [Desulfobacterales bacterium]